MTERSMKDELHKEYRPIVLTSAGIGDGYTKRLDSRQNKYIAGQTKEYFRTATGHKIGLPIYWRNKIYSEEEREKLWIEKLDKNERWIGGEKMKADDEKAINGALEWYRRLSEKMGFGTGERNYDREEYERRTT